MDSELEIVLQLLSETTYKIKEISTRMESMEDSLSGIDKTIANETYKNWKNILDREDLKIVCKTDPSVVLSLGELSRSSKNNAKAILNFNSSYTDKMGSVEKKLQEILRNQKDAILHSPSFASSEPIQRTEEKQQPAKNDLPFFSRKMAVILIMSNVITLLASVLFFKFL